MLETLMQRAPNIDIYIIPDAGQADTVSYTHLDVYKRQVVTSKVREGNFHDAMLIIEGMEAVHKITSVIRVYGEQE